MRLTLMLLSFGLISLATAAVAQVSTNEGEGTSAVRDRNDLRPGRQSTESPRGDGAEIGDLNSPDEPASDEEEFVTPLDRGDEGPEAALGGRPERTRDIGSDRQNATPGPRGGRPGNRWRYQYYNGYWWYWTPNNRWAFFNGRRWLNYNSELANQWARGGAVGGGAVGGGGSMGLGGGGYGSGLGTSYGASGRNGIRGGRGNVGGLGSQAGALGRGQLPGLGTTPGRSALPSLRGGGGSMAAGGLGPTGAGGSLGGGAGGSVGGGVTGEGLGSSLFSNSGGMAAVPGLSGTRGSLGGASGVGITAGGRSGDAGSGVGGGMIGGAGIGGTGGLGAGNRMP